MSKLVLQNNSTFEVLNSAVGSYHYKFDEAIIFLDPSDVIDELFIKWDNNENILINS